MTRFAPNVVSFVVMAFVIWCASASEAACTGGSPNWSATPDYASVSSCTASASSGDTIYVSAGTAQWSSAISVSNKNLTIVGAGAGSTVLTNNASTDFIYFSLQSTAGDGTNTSRVTGFTFTCGMVQMGGRGWRIHGNNFTCASAGRGIFIDGYASAYKTIAHKGLIDSNAFTNRQVLAYQYPATTLSESYGMTVWSTPLALGSDEAIYVEDNTFTFTAFFNAIDCQFSGKYVLRYNTITDVYIEAHSNQGIYRACRKWEVYGNTLQQVSRSVFSQMFLRGGTGMVFKNNAAGNFGAGIQLDNRRSFETFPTVGMCNGGSAWDTNALGNGWPCRDQIGTGTDDEPWVSGPNPPKQSTALKPAYFFLNTTNGAVTPVSVVNGSDPHIVADRSFYVYTSSFNGTSGVGAGTLAARPSTCTPGVAYWATDQGEWNTRNPGADGQLYKCTAPNTWNLYYTPYIYPHPLREAGTSAPPVGPGSSLSVR